MSIIFSSGFGYGVLHTVPTDVHPSGRARGLQSLWPALSWVPHQSWGQRPAFTRVTPPLYKWALWRQREVAAPHLLLPLLACNFHPTSKLGCEWWTPVFAASAPEIELPSSVRNGWQRESLSFWPWLPRTELLWHGTGEEMAACSSRGETIAPNWGRKGKEPLFSWVHRPGVEVL